MQPAAPFSAQNKGYDTSSLGTRVPRRAFSRIPPEVFAHIFEIEAPEFLPSWDLQSSTEWSHEEYHNFCLAVSWTHSQFRSIILASSRCWTGVAFNVKGIRPVNSQWLAILLSRSRPRKFDIMMSFDNCFWGARYLFLLDDWIVEVLRKHFERCRSLIITSPSAELIACLNTFRGIALPSLQVLRLFRGRGDDDSDLLSRLILDDSSLAALSITFEDETPLCDLNPSRLTSLRRLHLSFQVRGDLSPLFRALAACPSLEHLWWDCVEGYMGWRASDGPTAVVLPNLLSLRLMNEAYWIIPSLEAPCLEQLIIACRDGHDDDWSWTEERWATDGDYPIPRVEFLHARPATFPSLKRFACTSLPSMAGKTITSLLRRHPFLEDISVIQYFPPSRARVTDTEGLVAIVESLPPVESASLIDRNDDEDMGSESVDDGPPKVPVRRPTYDWLHFLLRMLASGSTHYSSPSPSSTDALEPDPNRRSEVFEARPEPKPEPEPSRVVIPRIELDIHRRRDDWSLPRWRTDPPTTFDQQIPRVFDINVTLDAITAALHAQPDLGVHFATVRPDDFGEEGLRSSGFGRFVLNGRVTASKESSWENWPSAWRMWESMPGGMGARESFFFRTMGVGNGME